MNDFIWILVVTAISVVLIGIMIIYQRHLSMDICPSCDRRFKREKVPKLIVIRKEKIVLCKRCTGKPQKYLNPKKLVEYYRKKGWEDDTLHNLDLLLKIYKNV